MSYYPDPNQEPHRAFVVMAVLLNLILATIMVIAMMSMCSSCGDNASPPVEIDAAIDTPPPPFTWGDAERSFATGWCLYAERCYPTMFAQYFPGGQKACVTQIAEQNCAIAYRPNKCTDVYPADRRDILSQCQAELTAIVCTATMAPDSCVTAFQPIY